MKKKKDKDGMAKNLEVVKNEFYEFSVDQAWNWKRLKNLEDNPFHLGVAFISTTYQTLPRTLTYITVTVALGCAVRVLINLLG